MSIFDQEDTFDENQDFLEVLTRPGGKFDRTKYASEKEMYQAIAKGKVFGDRTLDQRNKDFDDLREDFLKSNTNATASAKFDELKALLEARQLEPTITPVVNSEQSLDSTKIEELLEAKLAAREAKKKEADNMAVVESRLTEQFGERAKAVLRDKMNALSLTAEDLKLLAKRSPEAVLNTLGLNTKQQETYQGLPSSNLRSDNFVPQVDIHDALYWEKMRRENPKEYFSEKLSVQRLKDMDHPDFMTRHNQKNRRPL